MYDIKIREWSITEFKNQVLVELCLESYVSGMAQVDVTKDSSTIKVNIVKWESTIKAQLCLLCIKLLAGFLILELPNT